MVTSRTLFTWLCFIYSSRAFWKGKFLEMHMPVASQKTHHQLVGCHGNYSILSPAFQYIWRVFSPVSGEKLCKRGLGEVGFTSSSWFQLASFVICELFLMYRLYGSGCFNLYHCSFFTFFSILYEEYVWKKKMVAIKKCKNLMMLQVFWIVSLLVQLRELRLE